MCIMLNRKYIHSALCFVTFLFRLVVSGHETAAVKSNAVTYVKLRDVVLSGSGTRWRRSMSQQEKEEATSIHNTLRRREGASDMEYMEWNSYLASMAQDWADGCEFKHGQPPRDPSTLPYEEIGQNIYATSITFNITKAIENSWYAEKEFYDYDSLSCKEGEQCGHYTQIVWASSREIGCAYKLCSELTGTNFGKSTLFVCNYGPAGNYGGQKPYQKGEACSNCGSESIKCNEGLCYDGTDSTQSSSPSLLHSNHAKSLSLIIATMTLATMTSLTMRRTDFQR